MIHVWYIYLHLPYEWPKCSYIMINIPAPWIIWDWCFVVMLVVITCFSSTGSSAELMTGAQPPWHLPSELLEMILLFRVPRSKIPRFQMYIFLGSSRIIYLWHYSICKKCIQYSFVKQVSEHILFGRNVVYHVLRSHHKHLDATAVKAQNTSYQYTYNIL